MAVAARVVFALTLTLSLAAGVMALYARDVRRDRDTTRFFVAVGVAATVATVAVGWWWL